MVLGSIVVLPLLCTLVSWEIMAPSHSDWKLQQVFLSFSVDSWVLNAQGQTYLTRQILANGKLAHHYHLAS